MLSVIETNEEIKEKLIEKFKQFFERYYGMHAST
jgi:hypothetical protein